MGCCSSKQKNTPEKDTESLDQHKELDPVALHVLKEQNKIVKNGVELYVDSPDDKFIMAHYGGKENYSEYKKARKNFFDSDDIEYKGSKSDLGLRQGEGQLTLRLNAKTKEQASMNKPVDPKNPNGPRYSLPQTDTSSGSSLVKILTFDGLWFDGEFSKGKLNYNDGLIYEGRFTDNMASGVCKITYPDKNTYLGDVKYDLKHGWGVYKFPNGSYYKGDFKGETRTGSGEYYNATKKIKYVGDYFLDFKHGNGRITYADGAFYEGGWIKNKMYGHGILEKANGNVYTGDFKNGKKHGTGTMKNRADKWIYIGEWKHGKFDGKGALQIGLDPDDCELFEGPFTEGLKNGKFKITSKSGNITNTNIVEKK